MKKVLLLIFAVCTGLNALAIDNADVLIVQRKSGKAVVFMLKDKPTIALTADDMTITSGNATTVTYAQADVARFYFGDTTSDAIETTKVEASFTIKDGIIAVDGVKSGQKLEVFDTLGRKVASARADSDGHAQVKANNGVFIIKSGNNSFKVKL